MHSKVRVEDFLSRCDAGHVEGRRIEYNGKSYGMPYSTITVSGEMIKGLRENEQRINLLSSYISDWAPKAKSYLDIGCNLGVFVTHFIDTIPDAHGIDSDSYYVEMCHFLYPELEDRITLNNVNIRKLSNAFPDRTFDVITALSMIEYVNDKPAFIKDLYDMTNTLCIIEGHSEDVKRGRDVIYEELIRQQPWKVARIPETTDAGINAPKDIQNVGRPVWICRP